MEPIGTVTRRAAKGIPPRVRSPPRTKQKPVPKNAPKNHKRHASESGNDESEEYDSDTLGPKAHLKGKKRRRTEEPDEEEIVDEEEEEPPMEEVEDVNGEQSGGNEVSRLDFPLKWCTHLMLD